VSVPIFVAINFQFCADVSTFAGAAPLLLLLHLSSTVCELENELAA